MDLQGNVRKMLKRRGYKVFKKEDQTDYEFVIPFHDGRFNGKVFYTNKKIGQEDLGNIFRPYLDQAFHIIVIYTQCTAPAKNSYMNNISKYLAESELIEDTYFYQDIMSHPLIPEYTKLTEKEKKRIFDQYRTKASLFPQMQVTDPISIIMGFRVGDMVKVSCYYNFTKRCIDKDMPPSITYNIVSDCS